MKKWLCEFISEACYYPINILGRRSNVYPTPIGFDIFTISMYPQHLSNKHEKQGYACSTVRALKISRGVYVL